MDRSVSRLETMLTVFAKAGRIHRLDTGNGYFWELVSLTSLRCPKVALARYEMSKTMTSQEPTTAMVMVLPDLYRRSMAGVGVVSRCAHEHVIEQNWARCRQSRERFRTGA